MDNQTFINTLAGRLDSDPKATTRLVDALTETFGAVAGDVDSIAIPGFGTFQPVKLEECITVDKDGHRMLIPPSINLSFKESVVLRKKLKK